jgi:hypothetical protein
MTRAQIGSINSKRLASWADKLTSAHATPQLLLGVGHDHVSGQVSVIVCEEITNDQIEALLRFALDAIQKQRVVTQPFSHKNQ